MYEKNKKKIDDKISKLGNLIAELKAFYYNELIKYDKDKAKYFKETLYDKIKKVFQFK